MRQNAAYKKSQVYKYRKPDNLLKVYWMSAFKQNFTSLQKNRM
jgi:hypothetical protein